MNDALAPSPADAPTPSPALPHSFINDIDIYDFRSAYQENLPLQTVLLPSDFESTLVEIYEFLDRELKKADHFIAESLHPFIERLKTSAEVRQALLAHFALSPRDQYRRDRENELIREHPIRVANLGCILNLDDRAVTGLLLHDDKEDGFATDEIVENIFGAAIAQDVDDYSIPERPELERVYAEGNPDLSADIVGETLYRTLKAYFKDHVLVGRLKWRGLVGKLLDGVSNLKDDALNAELGLFRVSYEVLQRKNRTNTHNREALIERLLKEHPDEITREHLGHIINQVNIWSNFALAYRENCAAGHRRNIQDGIASVGVLDKMRDEDAARSVTGVIRPTPAPIAQA